MLGLNDLRWSSSRRDFLVAIVGVVLAMMGSAARADGPAVEVDSPLSPEQALAQFHLADGLRIELVACEPEVVDPVSIRFDEDGRLWVVEMRDYPNGTADGQTPLSRIRTLEDRDGDGRYETANVFADGLLFATGVQPWQGGAIVTLAGRVAYLKDTDGDGRADIDETWYTGFSQENPQLRANHPQFGLDNHIYVANGLRGGEVADPRRPDQPPLSISSRDFRFDPRGGDCEAVSGVGQFGLTSDPFGRRFVCSNRNPLRHIVLEERYLRANPLAAVPAVAHDVAASDTASRVFPLSRAWTTSNLHAGQFTAACGVLIYGGDALPPEFAGCGFTCEPTGNLVHAEKIEPAGATFSALPMFEGREFLATADEWFRPVDLQIGPDGALYVADMYRAVIEHPEWVPDELKHRPDERYGDDRGRIYRIVRRDIARADAPQPPRAAGQLSRASTTKLVALLDHPNAWQRQTAGRLLYERQDDVAVPLLEALARDGQTPAGRAAALWALDGLDALSDDALSAALADADPRVREQTVVLADRRLASSDDMRKHVTELADDADPRLRFQVALSLGLAGGEELTPTLAKIALSGADDVWTRRAVTVAAGDRAAAVFAAVLTALDAPSHRNPQRQQGTKPQRQQGASNNPPRQQGAKQLADELALVGELAALVGTRNQSDEVAAAAAAIVKLDGADAARIQRACLLGLAQSLGRRGTSLSGVESPEADGIARLFTDAAGVARDEAADDSIRAEAIDLLTYALWNAAGETLMELAQDCPSQDLRVRAIGALAAHGDPSIGPLLLTDFAAQTPTVRRAVLDATIDGGPRAALLLDEIAAGRIAATELDLTRAERLLKHRDAAIATRAGELLVAALPADRQQVLAEYQPTLELPADAARGRDVFRKQCTTCHRVEGAGVNVAPDISDTRTKTPAQLLGDILQPNRAIDANYVSYAVTTTDGRSLLGVISAETAGSVTLRLPEDKTVTLLRQDIDEISSTGRSLMPDGLEKNIPPQAMADLIAYLKNWRYLDGRTPTGN